MARMLAITTSVNY